MAPMARLGAGCRYRCSPGCQQGRIMNFFGHIVDAALGSIWGPADKVQHIFEGEALPFAAALRVWGDMFRHTCVFAFIDNESAKAAWITEFAQSKTAQNILHHGTRMEANLDIRPYFARVPASSSFGDAPSRGEFRLLLQSGTERIAISNELIAELCTPPFARRTPSWMRGGATWLGTPDNPPMLEWKLCSADHHFWIHFDSLCFASGAVIFFFCRVNAFDVCCFCFTLWRCVRVWGLANDATRTIARRLYSLFFFYVYCQIYGLAGTEFV